jgi:proteasome lid subunit RPN8/RPN11
MNNLHVFLNANSFINIVTSVVEGFKLEVGGMLFGDWFSKVNKIIVEQAIPLQTAKRKPTSVHFNARRTKRVYDMWDNLTPYWPIGDFHSHPEYGAIRYRPEPSRKDIDNLRKDEIEIIVAIWETERRKPLKYIREGKRISGAVGRYHVQLAAWYLDSEVGIQEAELWVPYIEIINIAYNIGLLTRPGRLFNTETTVSFQELRPLKKLIKEYDSRVFRTKDFKQAKSILQQAKKILKQIKRMQEARRLKG